MTNYEEFQNLGEFLAYKIKEKGYTNNQFALYANIRKGQISKLVNNKTRNPTVGTLRKIAHVLQVDYTILVRLSQNWQDKIVDEPTGQPDLNFSLLDKFFGRSKEIGILTESIASHRLIIITGLAGIGKTALVRNVLETLPKQALEKFEKPIFCTVNDDYTIADIADYVNYKSDHPFEQPQLPQLKNAIANILEVLTRKYHLLILDNLNLDHPEHSASYLQLLKQIAETKHQSCVIVTSQKHPTGSRAWQHRPQVISLKGLEEPEAIALLTSEGLSPQADQKFIKLLIQKYNSNPLGLKFAVQDIIELCDGKLELYFKRSTMFAEEFGEKIREILQRLPALELELLYWIALLKEDIPFYQIRSEFPERQRHIIDNNRINEMIKGLRSRSLLESNDGNFFLPPEVQACTEKSLLEQLSQEIMSIASDGDSSKLNWLQKLELVYEQINLRQRLSLYLNNEALSETLVQVEAKLVETDRIGYAIENLEYLLRKF
jgi:transcriptional regulator with XRE-family HTH domain